MKVLLFIFSIFLILVLSTSLAQNKSSLTMDRTFELPDVNGRIDHLSIDLKSNRLFVAALGNGTVEVIDLTLGKVIYSIKNLKEPQGVEYIQQYNLLFVSSGGDGTCKIFNASDFKLLKVIQLGDDADNIRYDRKSGIVFVGFGSGGIAAIDPAKMKLLYKINLPAHPESFQIDDSKGLMFVNVPDANQLDIIDINKKIVIDRIRLNIRDNFPMALDTIHQLIFIGTWNPPRLVLFDAKSFGNPSLREKTISENNISGDADDIYYDRADSLIFVSCGSGYIDIFKQLNSRKILLKEKIRTSPGARTSLYVPELNKLFVAARKYDSQNAKVIEYSINR